MVTAKDNKDEMEREMQKLLEKISHFSNTTAVKEKK